MLKASSTLRWIYIDLNSYFASVEQHLNPHLRGRPVAVVPTMNTDSTCAIAASYEAKALGIKTGTMIYQARRLCPDLHVVPARHDRYVEYHHLIMAEIEHHIPLTKICSIDEVACRLQGSTQDKTQAIALAHRIKQGISDNVGICLRSSIGIAPNRFLAKVASNLHKPDGLTVIESHELPDRLVHLNLRDLPGIGRRMERRLSDAGITSLKAFWDLDPRHARKLWHSVEGERFWYALRGVEIADPPENQRQTVGHSHVLSPAMRPRAKARNVARRLTVKAATRMRRLGFHATFYNLYVRYDVKRSPHQKPGPDRWQGYVKLPPTQNNFTLLTNLNSLWNAIPDSRESQRILQVSVALYGLIHQNDIMPDMFQALNDPLSREHKKHDRLSKAMDSVNKRFGFDTIVVGSLPEPMARFTGSKIAFTRIPQKDEFHE
ncbi:Y-family DNA polymerase [Paremcibacter congregatus]|uniref:DNA-directed DNA polymerase n=1 Tax=Paremcibacter congregatus TaxID=2043170 RepID=A0A2G4YUB5_9PROT|nr:impB/mucB/samB family protein [Paremcibacter congregatus]PHZ85867.1 impB/mucB/samB family protein [Paremcibacter congregatus]QDE26831.1 impB/mucB/samB family protein [Paremcibacter congregatus]